MNLKNGYFRTRLILIFLVIIYNWKFPLVGIFPKLYNICMDKKENIMIGFIIAIIIFNIIAFKTNKNLTINQILHIWLFTIAFQHAADVYVDLKYHGYWYFTKDVNWAGLPAHILLLPSVNMMFLNLFPFKSTITSKIRYLILWVIGTLLYEVIALLPEPWGYFHYGWWKLQYSAFANPILFLILLGYYKFICRLEKNLILK